MGWRAHYGVPLMDQEHNLIAQTGVCVGRGIVAALHLGASGRIEGRDERCRDLYNAALYQGREAYRALGQRVGYYAQKRVARPTSGRCRLLPGWLPGLARRDPAC